jgi:hypothetical protein
MLSQEELVNSWRSATDRPNVLVVDATQGPWVSHLLAMRSGERPCEVIVADTVEIGLRLLRRSSITVVAVDGDAASAGSVELVVEALAKEHPPRVLVFSAQASHRDAAVKRPVRRVRKDLEADTLHRLIQQCAVECAQRDKERTAAAELLEAVAGLPDALWLRITNRRGEAGDLCIRGGSAVYAEVSRQMGEAAGVRILSWTDCEFEAREMPECLRPNMNRSLSQIGRGLATAPAASAAGSDIYLMPEVNAAPAAASAKEPAAPVMAVAMADDEPPIDEPLDFPTLEQFAGEAAEMDSLAEPEDLPSFEMEAAEPDLSVEEPVDIMTDVDFALATIETGPEIRVTESLFAAVAVLGSGAGGLESCQPASEAGYFDAAWLRGHYVQAEQYALSRGLGLPLAVPILTELGGVVVAPLGSSRERLLAVRLRTPNFGDLELAELKRVYESLPAVGVLAHKG